MKYDISVMFSEHYNYMGYVIVPRLTARRRFIGQPVKSQGVGRDSSVVILTRDNQDIHLHLILVYRV